MSIKKGQWSDDFWQTLVSLKITFCIVSSHPDDPMCCPIGQTLSSGHVWCWCFVPEVWFDNLYASESKEAEIPGPCLGAKKSAWVRWIYCNQNTNAPTCFSKPLPLILPLPPNQILVKPPFPPLLRSDGDGVILHIYLNLLFTLTKKVQGPANLLVLGAGGIFLNVTCKRSAKPAESEP